MLKKAKSVFFFFWAMAKSGLGSETQRQLAATAQTHVWGFFLKLNLDFYNGPVADVLKFSLRWKRRPA